MPNDLLAIALSAAVSLYILGLQAKGGPSEDDLAHLPEVSELLASKGDVLLFGGWKNGVTATVFNEVARLLAVLSYAPGGVTLFGNHWKTVR